VFHKNKNKNYIDVVDADAANLGDRGVVVKVESAERAALGVCVEKIKNKDRKKKIFFFRVTGLGVVVEGGTDVAAAKGGQVLVIPGDRGLEAGVLGSVEAGGGAGAKLFSLY